MLTNWMAGALGVLLASALVASASAGSGQRRKRHCFHEMIAGKIGQLTNPDDKIRRDAAMALGVVPVSQAVPALIVALKDSHPAVCEAAEFALCRIAGTAPVDPSELPYAATTPPCGSRCEGRRR